MKVIEHVAEGLMRQKDEFDEMHSGFMSGRGTNDTVFMVRYLQEKHLTANKPLYMALVDLEEVFQHVPGDVNLVGNVQARNRQVSGVIGQVPFPKGDE